MFQHLRSIHPHIGIRAFEIIKDFDGTNEQTSINRIELPKIFPDAGLMRLAAARTDTPFCFCQSRFSMNAVLPT